MTDDGKPGLARRTLGNSAWGVLNFLVPLAIALLTAPFIVRELGADMFGVLSVVGITLGFFGFLDFGIGGAATRQVAAYFEKSDYRSINRVVSTVFAFYLLVGAIAGVGILLSTSVFVTRLLTIPAELQDMATVAFYISAPAFLVSLVSSTFMSIPSALQRYDVSTKVSLAISVVSTAVTLAILAFGGGLVQLMLAGLIIGIIGLPIGFIVARRMLPTIAVVPHWDVPMLKELFSFGGYFLVSQLGVLLLYQMDKLLIGHFLGVGAVTYYVVPGNLAQKIQGFVAAATAVIFPMSAGLFETNDHETIVRLYREGTRLVLILVATIAVPMAVFAEPFLRHWMGADIAAASTVVMVLLVITYALLSLTAVPWHIANGAGRAKINAIFTLAIAALDIAAFLVLVRPYGLIGAAVAYLLSVLIGVPILVAFTERRVLRLSGREFLRIAGPVFLVVLVQVALAFALRMLAVNLTVTVALMGVSALSFAAVYALLGFVTEGDRRLVSLAVQRFRDWPSIEDS